MMLAMGSSNVKRFLPNQAQFASDKVDLLGDARLENKQIFDTIPSLGELRHFLGVICEEIQTYQVWPVRCSYRPIDSISW